MSLTESFAQTGFAHFINSSGGRVVRIIAGIVSIVWGYIELMDILGFILIMIGLIPLVAGLFNLCLVSAILGGPISGPEVMKRKIP